MTHCYPHSEAQKHSEDGTRLFVVCTRCGATLREVSFTMPILDTKYRVTWKPTAGDRRQAEQNHGGQTLEELKDRCGVSWCELDAILANEAYGKNGARDTDRSRGRVYTILKQRNE